MLNCRLVAGCRSGCDMGWLTWLRDLVLSLPEIGFGVLGFTLVVLAGWPILAVSLGISVRILRKRGRLQGKWAPAVIFTVSTVFLFLTYGATIPWPPLTLFPGVQVVYAI